MYNHDISEPDEMTSKGRRSKGRGNGTAKAHCLWQFSFYLTVRCPRIECGSYPVKQTHQEIAWQYLLILFQATTVQYEEPIIQGGKQFSNTYFTVTISEPASAYVNVLKSACMYCMYLGVTYKHMHCAYHVHIYTLKCI